MLRLAALALLAPVALAALPPGNLIVAYAGNDACDSGRANYAAEKGANVLIWFSIFLKSVNGAPEVVNSPPFDCVAKIKAELEAEGLPTFHSICIGGWDAPHPNTTWSGAEWFDIFDAWNVEAGGGERLFDGIDWDLEGNDNPNSTYAKLPLETLHLMGEMSVAAKKAGYVVSLAPAQSYMDVTTTEFGYGLNYYPSQPWHQDDFPYAGRNNYCYLITIYGGVVFDFVSVQLYESYAPANYAVTQEGEDIASYLTDWAAALYKGYDVDYGHPVPYAGLAGSYSTCILRPDQLVIGIIANPEVTEKSVFISPGDIGAAWASMAAAEVPTPRGVMYWNAGMDGVKMEMAGPLNDVLHTRPQS